MSRFNTGNPINSLAEEDFYDNCLSLDQAMNSTDPTWRDRFNVEKPTIDAALKSAGFMPAGFDFVTGGTLQPGDRNKAVYNPAPNGDNNWYRWNGVFPKVITANSQPEPKNEDSWVPVFIKITALEREALRRTYQEVGLNLVEGSFEEGGVLNSINDVLLQESTGKAYGWSGPFPKTVLSNTDISTFIDKSMLIANLTVKPTDHPFNAPVDGSDATSQINAALVHCAEKRKKLILDNFFLCSGTINIPTGVDVICLSRTSGINSKSTGKNPAVLMNGVGSKIIGGTIKGMNDPGSDIRQDGVIMGPGSEGCVLDDVHVLGFFGKNFTGSGAGVGVGDKGRRNKVKNCKIMDSKFCLSLGGVDGEITYNYISNHYLTQTVEPKPWTSSSNYWDGIVSEGIKGYFIGFNHVTECGQSGIYTGGNGGFSKSNRIIGNVVEKCWNRGIDQGLNTPKSEENDVIEQLIANNICKNNRENNIWLAGTTRCGVTGNTSVYDSEYPKMFGGHYGGHTGIALTNGAGGDLPHGNSIVGNNCYDSEMYSNISISCGLGARGNIVDGNSTPQGIYLVNNSLCASNEFDFLREQLWTPQLIGSGGTVTISESSGKSVIKGRRVSFSCVITVGSVTTPSGHLTIGYVPPLSGLKIRFSSVRVVNYDGFEPAVGNSQLIAYLTNSVPDQINIARVNNGARSFDVRSFLKAGSTLVIAGEAEFYL